MSIYIYNKKNTMSIRIQREKLRLIQEANRRLDKQDRDYSKGKLKDREVSKGEDTPCDTYVPSEEYSTYCDWETTGMIWDPAECKCVPLIF